MPTTVPFNTMRVRTLVAADYTPDSRLDPQAIRDFIGPDAMAGETCELVPHFRDKGRMIRTYRFEFDANQVRNTEVHGAGYRAGYVVHVES